MIRINAIKLEINTTDGLYGAYHKFEKGLNIIRGNNTSGKSSLFQSIIYGLGFEELLGGKNEKTMQSVLKDQVEYPKENFHKVLQSFIYLELENKTIITVKRSIICEGRKSQLIDVFDGALITGDNKLLTSRPMYIHDKGGASDDIYGFHRFLSEFFEFDLPEAISTKGETTNLYLQQIAPAYIIEQKSGWSDFFATMPHFSMKNVECRIIECLLELDVFENEKKKQSLSIKKQKNQSEWNLAYRQLSKLAEKSSGKLIGIEPSPSIINDNNSLYLGFISEDRYLNIYEYISNLRNELVALEKEKLNSVGENISSDEAKLQQLTEELTILSLKYEMLSPELSYDKEKLQQYSRQLDLVNEDLRKNKGALKVNKLGSEISLKTANHNCPTCSQDLKDSLLPSDISQTPMRLEDNIEFLEAQQNMILVNLDGQKNAIRNKENLLAYLVNKQSETRKRIRGLKKELVQDERLPSELDIELKLNLKKKIEFFDKTALEFSELAEEIKSLSKEFGLIISNEKDLPKDFLSITDRSKLSYLEDQFKKLLKSFNYSSKPINAIKISTDSYLPVAQISEENLFYNIKFDSSASDFIRCMWAYYISLLDTSIKYQANHPLLLMFDEPKQQDISISNFREFLKCLSNYHNQQILVFASFENSDETYEETTKDIAFNLVKIEGKLVKPLVETEN